ncbi:hypothetical protein CYMTET_22124 [Cymbomonas tetramitiformis]|uniref:Uncharacterized protein n=1 Tax=Cymbomonas tetramitiformis TaxID=36881 RepID=A0AAE0L2A6_9CHLO|nr:hypothetical protein CYMTET_22124 [Cymbomonas tetramitiformis]
MAEATAQKLRLREEEEARRRAADAAEQRRKQACEAEEARLLEKVQVEHRRLQDEKAREIQRLQSDQREQQEEVRRAQEVEIAELERIVGEEKQRLLELQRVEEAEIQELMREEEEIRRQEAEEREREKQRKREKREAEHRRRQAKINAEREKREGEVNRLQEMEKSLMSRTSCRFCGTALTSRSMERLECPEGPWYHPGMEQSRAGATRMSCCGRAAQGASNGCKQRTHVGMGRLPLRSGAGSAPLEPLPRHAGGAPGGYADRIPQTTAEGASSYRRSSSAVSSAPLPGQSLSHNGTASSSLTWTSDGAALGPSKGAPREGPGPRGAAPSREGDCKGHCKRCSLMMTSSYMLQMECPKAEWFHPGVPESFRAAGQGAAMSARMSCCGRPHIAGNQTSGSTTYDSSAVMADVTASNGCRQKAHILT